MRRSVVVSRLVLATATVTALAGSALVAAPSASAAAADPECVLFDEPPAHPDLDGDGRPDVGVGVPSATVAGVRTGAVDIHYGSGRVQRFGPSYFTGVSIGAGGQFGAALSAVPIEISDRCDDLAVTAPGAGGGRGAVVLAHSGASGVRSAGARVLTGRTSGERFGAAVAVGVRTTGGNDLFVGAPQRTVSGRVGAGAVDHYFVPDDGSAPRYLGQLTQDSPGVPGVAEAGDHFGAVLAMAGRDLAVGIPDEAQGSRAQAGNVEVLRLAAGTNDVTAGAVLAQGYQGTPGVAETGDRFGAALAWAGDARVGTALVVGSPGEAVGSRRAVGIIYSYNRFSPANPYVAVRVVTQDSSGIPGVNEPGDQFGASLTPVNWCPGAAVAVGAPGEAVGSRARAGQVTVVQTASPGTNRCERAFWQGSGGGLGGAAEAGDEVGASLSELTSSDAAGSVPDRLLIGVPGEGVGSLAHTGGVTVVSRSGTSYSVVNYGDSGGRVAGARYGAALLQRWTLQE